MQDIHYQRVSPCTGCRVRLFSLPHDVAGAAASTSSGTVTELVSRAFCSFGDYFWPALVVWAFDRVLRAARLVWNNSGKGTTHEHGSAIVELVSSDTIRLTLRRKMSWRPGQHAYVLLPTVSDIPTEAHPFTIASIPTALDGTDGPSEKEVVFLVRGRSGFTGRLREYAARNGICRVPAFIDGPYGCPPDLTKFTTCVLLAGTFGG